MFCFSRWLILPWLIFYFVVIVGLITAVPVILIWFIWLHPAPIWSLLSIIPAFLALMVTYFWLVVNGFFMEVRKYVKIFTKYLKSVFLRYVMLSAQGAILKQLWNDLTPNTTSLNIIEINLQNQSLN